MPFFQWEKLSNLERLVLLSIAFEVPQINGFHVLSSDAIHNSGLTEKHFWPVLKKLESKGLVTLDGEAITSCLWIKLEGEATSLNIKATIQPASACCGPVRA